MKNETNALLSFAKNNVRAEFRGQEQSIMQGINPLKLLSKEDHFLLKIASESY